jgi:hypothetical protein
MGSKRVSISYSRAVVLAAVLACVAVLPPVAAIAGNQVHGPAAEAPGFFESIGRWFDQQASKIKSTFGGAGSTVEQFGHEAGIAASTTVGTAKDVAKDAADAVARLPSARVVSGHEKCRIAPNGAPDCGAAADAMCRTKGFKSGSSVDMTTAEVCPPKVLMAGRMSGPGCHTETFVSSALCQ